MLGSKQYRLAKRMRWAARIIGLLAAGFCLFMLIGSAVAEVLTGAWETTSQADIIQGSLIGVLGAIALAGCIVSWWRERLASILLVLTAVGFGIHIGLFAGRNHFLVWLMMGLPYLVASVLLLKSWQLFKKTLEEQKGA
ncbi:unnamed protein product [marine sediment metagenome]|uniref:DUF7670 domain-containing protein n=1 Tax=marine sediment metagenome TaxID=412755 RepID=X1KRN0_9ZZZZ